MINLRPLFSIALLSILATPAVTAKPSASTSTTSSHNFDILAQITPPSQADTEPHVTLKVTARTYGTNAWDNDAYWDGDIRLTNVNPHVQNPGPWRVRFDKTAYVAMPDVTTLQPGDMHIVDIDLNNPPLTFDYAYDGPHHGVIPATRHLPAGEYRMDITLRGKRGTAPVVQIAPLNVTVKGYAPAVSTLSEEADYVRVMQPVVDMITKPGGLWENGFCEIIPLPSETPTDIVIAAAVNREIEGGKRYDVLMVKDVDTAEPFSHHAHVALLDTGRERKILLFYSELTSWWTRLYNVSAAP